MEVVALATWPSLMIARLPQFQVMDEVAIPQDTLGYSLPVGEKGYVLTINVDPSSAFRYLIRIPSRNTSYWVPECDVMPWQDYIDKSIHQAIGDYRVNDALDRRDFEAFDQATRERQTPPRG